MRDICRRIKNIEDKLNLSEKPKTVTIVQYGIGKDQVPPDQTVGNMTIHCVMYDEIATKSNQKQPNAGK